MRHLIKKIVNKMGYDIHKLNNNIYNYNNKLLEIFSPGVYIIFLNIILYKS